jgi:sulfatase maturation enzyme AslB (radical SAM superfamily)
VTLGIAQKTVQVHLSRRCNLACLHCYSRSGPRERETLSAEIVAAFLRDAASQGYEVAAFSGGEPFLHPDFADIVEAARDAGLSPVAVTNATILTGRRARIIPRLDLVAVSVDGPEEVHNRLRGSPSAFARMRDGLEAVRAAGIPFGIVHTVTRESLPWISWMADFARAAGANLLQLHPLGLVGAAGDRWTEPLDGETLARTYLAGLALAEKHGDALRIQVDLFNREQLRRDPAAIVPPAAAAPGARLAEIVNPLVLLSNGEIAPICHDLAAPFRVASVFDRSRSFADSASAFLRDGLPRLHDFCRNLAERVLADSGAWPYFNWYELIEREAPALVRLSLEPAAAAAAE